MLERILKKNPGLLNNVPGRILVVKSIVIVARK
jgi:hypothetical protein